MNQETQILNNKMYCKHVDLTPRKRNYVKRDQVKLSGIEEGKQIVGCMG